MRHDRSLAPRSSRPDLVRPLPDGFLDVHAPGLCYSALVTRMILFWTVVAAALSALTGLHLVLPVAGMMIASGMMGVTGWLARRERRGGYSKVWQRGQRCQAQVLDARWERTPGSQPACLIRYEFEWSGRTHTQAYRSWRHEPSEMYVGQDLLIFCLETPSGVRSVPA